MSAACQQCKRPFPTVPPYDTSPAGRCGCGSAFCDDCCCGEWYRCVDYGSSDHGAAASERTGTDA
jgi:hypothetical protein